jgi:hypothetical protein
VLRLGPMGALVHGGEEKVDSWAECKGETYTNAQGDEIGEDFCKAHGRFLGGWGVWHGSCSFGLFVGNVL